MPRPHWRALPIVKDEITHLKHEFSIQEVGGYGPTLYAGPPDKIDVPQVAFDWFAGNLQAIVWGADSDEPVLTIRFDEWGKVQAVLHNDPTTSRERVIIGPDVWAPKPLDEEG